MTVPAEPTKEARLHRDGRRRLSQGNRSRSTREVDPLNWFASCCGASVGGAKTKTCTWSGMTSRASTVQSSAAAFSCSSATKASATAPPSTGRRYFGHQTRW